MKRLLVLTSLLVLAIGCGAEEKQAPLQVTTIDRAPVALAPIETLPTVDEEIAPVVSKHLSLTQAERKRMEEASMAERVELPFAPAIAMDPVDGQKVSIRKNTPQHEYKKKIYYFTSEANRRAFLANPEHFTKGSLAKYQ